MTHLNTMPPLWCDSHCHLDFPDFADAAEGGVAGFVERAQLQGVSPLLTISTHVTRAETYKTLAETFPHVWASIGVHPHQAGELAEQQAATVENLIALSQHPKIVAIGETGLDYHYTYAAASDQAMMLRRHIQAARATSLPLIIHAREADDDMMAIIADELGDTSQGKLNAVMHCFSSGDVLLDFALAQGFYISFSGIVTFPKSVQVQAQAKRVPLDRLLIETDAPYLAPAPHRGKRNEPGFAAHTGRFLAQLLGVPDVELATQICSNFATLFSKVQMPC